MFDKKAWEAVNRERRLAAKAASYAANREARIAESRAYQDRHREEVRAQKSAYYQRRKPELIASQMAWAKENREKVRATNRKFERAHPESGRTRTRNRAARKRAAEGSHTEEEILALAEQQGHLCANPRCMISIRDGYHADHIKSLARGGSNWIENIQLLCQPCNHRKGSKDPERWAREEDLRCRLS